MIDLSWDQFVAAGWLYALFRVLFIAGIYFFLFLVLRTTVRELNLAARQMGSDDGRTARVALRVVDPGGSSLRVGAAIPVPPVALIGRDATSTLLVDDPHVSARHAELRFERGQWWLRDLGSSNGTWLNGNPVRAVMGVRAGDDLQCAGVRFHVVPLFPVPAERDST
ncbi:MAG: FHA domain-containing protein [Thermomicrobiales bacterium]